MTGESEETENAAPFAWSPVARLVASLVIGFYLFVVVIGPLSNPIASEHLTGPLSRIVSPFHQALFLGHGYRFFGPDPGPSHLVYYKITRADGDLIEGHFPDRDENWPRLLYHRWFMLSETLYEEHAFTPDQEAFDAEQEALEKEIAKKRSEGVFESVKTLEAQKLDRRDQYERTRQRIDAFVTSLESHLLQRYGGEKVELFLRERMLPEPTDVRLGVSLDDPRYLSPLLPIGAAARNSPPQVEPLPAVQEPTNGF